MPSSTPARAGGRRALRVLTAGAAACLLCTAGTAAASHHGNPPPGPRDYIVQLDDATSASEARAVVRRHGGRVIGDVELIHGVVARMTPADARALRHDPAVHAVSPNAKVTSSTNVISTKYLQTAYPYAVSAPGTWNITPATNSMTGKGVGVAVIDTGIAGRVPDFRRSATDLRSRVVGSVVINPLATTPGDSFGHGTHVAGIIAGNGNNRTDGLFGQYVGVAPDADLVSVKVSDETGAATVLDVIYGLQFVVDQRSTYNIRVVNLSLNSTVAESATTDPLVAATEAAWNSGLVVVASAGNRGTAAGSVDYAPANSPYIITVGAADDRGTPSDSDDVPASWSSRGVTQDGIVKPEVSAPGAHMVSTLAPNSAFASLCPSCVVDGAYIRAGGTSMAAPVVSGVVAMMLERRPWLTPNHVKGVLMGTADPIGDGASIVNATSAVYTSSTATANAGLTPSTLIDPATGLVDPSRSSWSRSSWSQADPGLTAEWARSSWSCDCSMLADGTVDPSRSSWSRSSWSTSWTK